MQVGPNASLFQALSNLVQPGQQQDPQQRGVQNARPAADQGAPAKSSAGRAALAKSVAATAQDGRPPLVRPNGGQPSISQADDPGVPDRNLPRGSIIDIVV